MTWLRHSSRHVHRTLFNHLKAELDALGWTIEGATPFGAPVVTLVDTPIVDGDQVPRNVSAGSVHVTLGGEPDPDPQELGGPLAIQDTPIFIDVFMDAHGHALALASDIRDILLGRIGGRRRLNVIDQTTGNPVPGWGFELVDVERSTPTQSLALHWQVVKATAQVQFPEEVY